MTASNANQIANWNSGAGERWRDWAEQSARAFEPLTLALIERAAPCAGESVLDIGCGCGATTIELARRVGPQGTVVGLDVSEPMLGKARSALGAQPLKNVEFLTADAATHRFTANTCDLLFSQFGVMFFADPIATFANLHGALRAPARLAFSCWREYGQNPYFGVPDAALIHVLGAEEQLGPGFPGALSFSDPDRVRAILTAAGFSSIEIEAFEFPVPIGTTVDEAFVFLSHIGTVARRIAQAEPSSGSAATKALRDALAQHATPQGVFLNAGIWIVTALAQ